MFLSIEGVCSPGDYEQIKRRAEKVKQTLSEYVRTRAFTFGDREIAMIKFPNGSMMAAGEVAKGQLIFAGPEYDSQKVAGNGEEQSKAE